MKDLIAGSGLSFADRGEHVLKGARRVACVRVDPEGEDGRRNWAHAEGAG